MDIDSHRWFMCTECRCLMNETAMRESFTKRVSMHKEGDGRIGLCPHCGHNNVAPVTKLGKRDRRRIQWRMFLKETLQTVCGLPKRVFS